MTSALITKEHNGLAFTFRADGWFNMTKAAKHFGKRIDNFFANAETREYLNALDQIPGKLGNWIDPVRGQFGGAPLRTPSWLCSSPVGWTCASRCGVTR